MKSPKQTDSQSIEIRGILEKIYFHNDKTGYSAFRLRLESCELLPAEVKKNGSITCTGICLDLHLNDQFLLRGSIKEHPRYGIQFAFETIEEIMPSSEKAIVDYLCSGYIKGIFRTLAERITETFGADTLDIIDREPERLLEIKGISAKRFELIMTSWNEHRSMRALFLFLKPFGFSIAQTNAIFFVFGAEAISRIQANPYALAFQFQKISFDLIDKMALSLGIPEDSPLRLKTILLHVLRESTNQGHVYLPKEMLYDLAIKKVPLEKETFEELVMSLQEDRSIVAESYASLGEKNAASHSQNEEIAIYLRFLYEYERSIAYDLKRILDAPKSVAIANPDKVLNSVLDVQATPLEKLQREAVSMAAKAKVLVLTGGPGTGKTTTINSIIKLFESVKASILLCAPTGRAARRMHEASGQEAKTIHRMLEYSPLAKCFTRGTDNPLSCDLLIVDEASMLDISLFYHLLKAIPDGCTLILVGDIYQLPSVGPGAILSDIIHSQCIPVVELKHIFRQPKHSAIVRNAHKINDGIVPSFNEKATDFYFMEENDPEKCANTIVDLIVRRLPNYYHYDSINDIQVLSPMHKGYVGITELNKKIQEQINKNTIEVKRSEYIYRLNDKVMQIRNDYDKDVFNGDLGTITSIDLEGRTLIVSFDDKKANYTFDELDNIIPAYAISIHKSQGSEYPVVIIPMSLTHSWMLERNLIYTAVTRGKKLVIIIGEYAALVRCVQTNTTHTRYTRLKERIIRVSHQSPLPLDETTDVPLNLETL